ncbi:hypothetical protein B0O80DRAFT_495077 [Mortierella sp. GBAus27b]|nr:hypothetical protein BGX31_003628 [Mortierella sp. GBA43]KAI8359556.1 hypothetical protein B0O80DRAFT_495077 [Mortierella sp. GBAus27b]
MFSHLVLFTILILISSISTSPIAFAQKFRPTPLYASCNAFVERQGLYVIGGQFENLTSTTQSFMIDLSVPWNTSDPVFKKIADGPMAAYMPCTMTSDGQELFTLTLGTGYIYNVKSDSWSIYSNTNFEFGILMSAITDPESGLIYLPGGAMNFQGRMELMALNLETKKFTTTLMPGNLNLTRLHAGTWSVPTRSLFLMVTQFEGLPPALLSFTPENANDATFGWKIMNTTGEPPTGFFLSCFLPVHGGSKIASFGGGANQSAVFTLDVATLAWTKGPPLPGQSQRTGSACAVSGDQLISWGGNSAGKVLNETVIYDMKAQKWTSNYIVPPPLPTTTRTPQPSQTSGPNTQDYDDTSSGESKLIIIIAVATGILLVIILATTFICLRRARRRNSADQNTGSIDSSSDSVDTKSIDVDGKVPLDALPRNPASCATRPSPDHTQPRRLVAGQAGRVHLGSIGARPVSVHPHAVQGPLTLANAQEGSLGARPQSQHPHTEQAPGQTFNSSWSLSTYIETDTASQGRDQYVNQDAGSKEELP